MLFILKSLSSSIGGLYFCSFEGTSECISCLFQQLICSSLLFCTGCGYNSFLLAICCILCLLCSISWEEYLWICSYWCLFFLCKLYPSYLSAFLVPLKSTTLVIFIVLWLELTFRPLLFSSFMFDAQPLIQLILVFCLKLTTCLPTDHRMTQMCLVSVWAAIC